MQSLDISSRTPANERSDFKNSQPYIVPAAADLYPNVTHLILT